MITGQPKEENQTHICMDKTVSLELLKLVKKKFAKLLFFAMYLVTTTGYIVNPQERLNIKILYGGWKIELFFSSHCVQTEC